MRKSLRPLAIAVSSAVFAAAAHAETAITIYSSAQPGAISPEFYRPIPGQGVPNAMSVPAPSRLNKVATPTCSTMKRLA